LTNIGFCKLLLPNCTNEMRQMHWNRGLSRWKWAAWLLKEALLRCHAPSEDRWISTKLFGCRHL
jgi:hypothetical protein